MADISLIEFIVYGFITYSGFLMLVISVIKEIPITKSGSIARAIYLLPSGITSLVLAFSGEGIKIETITNTITSLNTSEVWTEAVTSEITLLNPIWVSIHFLIFAVIMVFVFTQIIQLFVQKD